MLIWSKSYWVIKPEGLQLYLLYFCRIGGSQVELVLRPWICRLVSPIDCYWKMYLGIGAFSRLELTSYYKWSTILWGSIWAINASNFFHRVFSLLGFYVNLVVIWVNVFVCLLIIFFILRDSKLVNVTFMIWGSCLDKLLMITNV